MPSSAGIAIQQDELSEEIQRIHHSKMPGFLLVRQGKMPSFYVLDRPPISRHSRVLTKIGKPAISFLLGNKLMEAIRWPNREKNSLKVARSLILERGEEEKKSYKYRTLFTKEKVLFFGH